MLSEKEEHVKEKRDQFKTLDTKQHKFFFDDFSYNLAQKKARVSEAKYVESVFQINCS